MTRDKIETLRRVVEECAERELRYGPGGDPYAIAQEIAREVIFRLSQIDPFSLTPTG